MILDRPRVARVPSGQVKERLELARRLLDRFSASFPAIEYGVLWQSDTVNAQAVEFSGRRIVKLYGGLVRHPAIGLPGLAFTLAHETGHHLGGAPFDRCLPWLSSDRRADEWAETVGLPQVFGRREARALVAQGQRQISEVRSSTALQFH